MKKRTLKNGRIQIINLLNKKIIDRANPKGTALKVSELVKIRRIYYNINRKILGYSADVIHWMSVGDKCVNITDNLILQKNGKITIIYDEL